MFKEETKLYLTRCELFFKRLLLDRFQETIPLEASFANTKNEFPWQDRGQLKLKSICEGEIWASAWETAWFKISAQLPKAWQGKEVALVINLMGETMIFDAAGKPIYAVTGNSVFNTSYHKDLFFPPKEFWNKGKIEFWAEAAANSLFGVNLETDPHRMRPDIGGKFEAKVLELRMGLFNREAWALRFDFEILLELYKKQNPDSYRARQLLTTMNAAIDAYSDKPENAGKAREILKKELSRPANNSALTAAAVGHAHIDVAWLWPVRESRRKAARTFSSQLELIRRYPGYIFGASQPQLYEFVEQAHPELFKEIQAAVRAGSWEVQGGMWVEADCNIISGESMVRQFVHGKNYFMDKFGVEVKSLWLPDVFGYSAALPQIIRKSGCDFFLTQKLSWNQFNTFPHNTFIWKGLDGSEVLTHFPPENTYNASATPAELVPAQDRYAQGDIVPEFASLFGLGDGGGGPSENHIERALRMQNLEGCPRVKFCSSEAFFKRIKKYIPQLPTWDGELYLEMHRGTLTNQARTKKNNRRLEQLLQTAESLAAMGKIADYPLEVLHRNWRVLLLNQFHDIIPGSSIQPVYEVTEWEHAEAIEEVEKLIESCAKKISKPQKGAVFIANTLPVNYTGTVEIPEPKQFEKGQFYDENGERIQTQREHEKIIVLVNVPANRNLTLYFKPEKTRERKQEKRNDRILENSLIRYKFNECGELISAYDKVAKREIVPAGKVGNRHTLFHDRPNDYEGWDIDVFYRNEEQTFPHAFDVSETMQGEVQSSLTITKLIGKSHIEQTVVLRNNSKRLDFITQVDWREKREMLRVEFPVEVDAHESKCEIQYGFLSRPLHENTSWDKAKFEVVGQRYADLSERDYGAAVLNDSKYGYRLRERSIELCLLRSAMYPDPRCENGEHHFTYSFLPHEGDLINSNVMAEAAMLNRKPKLLPNRKNATVAEFYVNAPFDGIALEVVKRAEKSNARVLRLVEKRGIKTTGTLHTSLKNCSAYETNLIEWTRGNKLGFNSEGTLNLSLNPFEIKTIIIEDSSN